ncbi:uncharacterized protein LOC100830897 isoform X2 [Brachypodium distachyon]|uniref:CW-type domain-containing protein n=1 Tax=Brachypodium distachyon TaxID=15368 RepID=A0A0Q3HGA4_BRADI|nr:uncharacterized protein LOC100830897 isoform X2 [Brachypodium distachyon]KQK21712.1 hypothetical protein BRADI_1g62580v3 [Brachypodium distachyon]|eukprot:XP_010228629.1 uncharacterized protein LOC100830897 isoform X2 [Brachypodium distachyon]
MLSLRGRQGERGGGAGFRGMADDVELEEGEACSDDDGGHGFVDPDVALAYIDEKLQNVLGHFQKDFEGGVSADNLGPKFGGYGSFLPTYQRSPTPLPQTRSSPKVANISTSRKPYQQSTESMRQNPSTVAAEYISRNNCAMGTSSGDLCKKERRSSRNHEKDSVSCSGSLDSSSNGTDHKARKVRIRVGSSNTLVGGNASIYSGLGLDISSSSSMENSPDGLEGLSPEFGNMPYESPRTILQIMTCFSVPGGFLLSPLHGNVLHLTNKVAPLLKKWEKHLDVENLTIRYEGHSEPALHVGHFRSHVSKKMKLDSKGRKTIDTKTRKNVDGTNTIMNKEINIEASACQEISDTPSIPCISGGDTYITEVKRMQKERKINATAPSGFLEDDKYIHSSAAVIDRKNDSLLKSNHFENKAKEKPHKELAENLPVGSQVDKEGDMLENRNAQCDLQQREMMMNDNNEKEFEMSGTARKKILASAQHGKFPASEEQELHMPATSTITTTNAAPHPAPVVIKENWVCCDMCQKWRLLPYGTNPSMLPQKWKCIMLNWLPGMNRCDIGEDETTNALNALYATQAPATGVSSGGPHTAAAGTAVSSTHSISGQLEQSRKRTLKDGNGLHESSYPTPSSFPLMRNQQAPTENKRTVDGEHYPFERDSVSKHGLEQVSKSANFVVEKQKNKHNSHSSYSDGGDLIEKSKKHSKFSNKRGTDQDEHKTSKKTKKEDLHHFGGDWNHKCDLTAGKVPDETETLPAKEKPIKSSCEQVDISLRKDKVSSRYDLLENPKKIDDGDVAFGNKKREHHEAVGRLDLSTKNIAKECEEIQEYSADHASKGAKNERLKERKLKTMKSKELTSKVGSRHENVQDADTVLSSAEGRLNNELVVDNKFVTGKEVPSELWENVPPSEALESAEPHRRDAAYLQTSTVATSSSSKISSSRKNKNSQEPKGSPVESVSSSPLRGLNTEKLSHGRLTGKDGSLNVDASAAHNSGIEVGELCNGRQAQNLGESQAAYEPILPSSLQGNSDSNKGIPHLAHAQVTDVRIPIGGQGAHSHLKEGKSGVLSTPVKSDASKMKAQLRRSNVETGSQHGTRKQAFHNTSDTASLIRKDNNMVAFALKEARDLKHMANHLKSKGQALESTGLYFEAALKFLHVASLLETPSLDSSRPADAAQSMKMYSETAKLCDFCAHAYERCKEMAAAALAYKCVEVAYLKSAYYKHPSASKDRQELQAVVQIAPDIDNLNSHGVSKAPSTKGGNSPQVACSLLPLAVRNQAHLLRLLAYTNDVTCAFDATRKSQIAIAACAGNQEGGKGLGDGLGSVRTVLDLNFNNVEELLRLVRLSMESIGSS